MPLPAAPGAVPAGQEAGVAGAVSTRHTLRYGRIVLRFAALSVSRPRLIGPLVRAAWRFRARRWWAKPPFLPLPPHKYLEWRMHTAFGSADAVPEAEQLARYLRWTRQAVGGRERSE